MKPVATPRVLRGSAAIVLTLVSSIAACGDDPTTVEFQVIEEAQFAPSLGIDLGAMERLNSGVYIQDLVDGVGDTVFLGTTPTVTYTGWLIDGTEFDSSTRTFLMGANRVVSGFEDGILYSRVGGTRKVVVPPNRGHGGLTQYDPNTGAVVIPGGSILVFEITMDSVDSGQNR